MTDAVIDILYSSFYSIRDATDSAAPEEDVELLVRMAFRRWEVTADWMGAYVVRDPIFDVIEALVER